MSVRISAPMAPCLCVSVLALRLDFFITKKVHFMIIKINYDTGSLLSVRVCVSVFVCLFVNNLLQDYLFPLHEVQ